MREVLIGEVREDEKGFLNAPEPAGNNENGVEDQNPVESPEEPAPQHLPAQQSRPGMQTAPMHPNYLPVDAQQIAYQNYLAQQQQQQRGGYPGMPPQAGMPQQHSHQA